MKLLPSWFQLRYGRAERRMTWLMVGIVLLSVPILLLFHYSIFQWYTAIPVLLTYFVFVYLDHRVDYDPLLLHLPPK
jgi:hypothetical protein